jgi:SAM-dependent methyltransferase
MTTGDSGKFAAAWDDYAARSTPPAGQWPGDEWGDERLWSAWFRRLFEAHGVASWRRAIEIGQGSGKYTARVLVAAPQVELLAIDVSARFQKLCGERLAADVSSGRLHFALISEKESRAVAKEAARRGWSGTVDAVFSIDTLVHLTAHQLAALLLGATEALKPGGLFIGTFADGTSAAGLHKLVGDVERVVAAGGDPASGCFHWSSPQAITALAKFCGYAVVLCDVDPEHHRDGHFVLRFADAAAAAAARKLRDGAS